MPFDSDSARKAAKKRWETFKMKDHGLPEKNLSTKDILDDNDGAELPVNRDPLAAGIAEWPDLVYELDPNAYHIISRCPAIFSPIKKLAVRIAKLDWVVVGQGPDAIVAQESLDNAKGLPQAIEWLLWALVEGVRFVYKDRGVVGGVVVPDFRQGGRKKKNAGGLIQWDGTRIVQVREVTGVATAVDKTLNRDDWIVFRPGGGSNPEGEPEIGLIAYDIAKDYTEARKNMAAYMELHGVPMRVIKRRLDKARSSQISGLLGDAAEKYARIKNNQVAALSSDDSLELLEPKGQGFKDMREYTQELSSEFQAAILGNTLTTNTATSGPAGSSDVHLQEEDEFVMYYALLIADALTDDLLPWMLVQNGRVPSGDLYIHPQPSGQRDTQNQVKDETDLTDELTEDGVPDEQDRTEGGGDSGQDPASQESTFTPTEGQDEE